VAALIVAAGLVMTLAPRRASAFEPGGHEIIEATAYKRLLSLEVVPGTRVSGRLLLATLIIDGVLRQPPCFDLSEPGGMCGPERRLELPLAYWPVLGSGGPDLIIDRQLDERGQCQHFMARTSDNLTPLDPHLGVPVGLVTDAYARCARLAGVALDGLLHNPRLANWRLVGMYALMHGIEDSFSAAHVARDGRWNVQHLLSWTLIDWPTYFALGIYSFPPETHHAVHDDRDLDYLRWDGRADNGQRCKTLLNPYAVPESCLTERARHAASAIVDLLVAAYRVRAQAEAEGRTPTLSSPEGTVLWSAFLRTHIPSVEPITSIPTETRVARPRPDLFAGAQVSGKPGAWGVGLWGTRLLVGPAVPFVLGFTLAAGYTRADSGGAAVAHVGVGLLLPLVRRFAIGVAPAGGRIQCDTGFHACTTDVTATLGILLVPVSSHTWLGVEGPQWSWTERALTGAWAGVAFGWSHELGPEEEARRATRTGGPSLTWNPPPPSEVTAFRLSRWTRLVYVAASVISNPGEQFVGAGVEWRRDRDRWDQRSGPLIGFAAEVDHGALGGNQHAGALALAPVLGLYLVPNRIAVTTEPARVLLGAVAGPGFGADIAGRAGLVLDLGKVELIVDSPPLSYVSPDRWHALPFSLRLGLRLE
jgi:hypothetical protein